MSLDFEHGDGFLRIGVPVINEETYENAQNCFNTFYQTITNTSLRKFIEGIRMKTLGETLEFNPITLMSMNYTANMFNTFAYELAVENGFAYLDENEEPVLISMHDDHAPEGVRAYAQYADDHGGDVSTFGDYLDTLDDATRNLYVSQLTTWSETSEIFAFCLAASACFEMAIHDAYNTYMQ